MKNAILVFVVGCVSAAILPGQLIAQDSKSPNGLASAQSNNKPGRIAVSPDSSSAYNAAGASATNSKAIKDFRSRFAGAADEKWFSEERGYVAYFTQDGFTNRAYYDKKGRWNASLKYCTEDKLPRDVRAMVKSTYYDFQITVIEVIEIPGHMAYLIHLEDAKTIKIVRVSGEGDMDVYKEFTKA